MNNDIKRRVKIIRLDDRLLVDILNWCRNPEYALALPITEELPDTVDVLSVRADWETNTIEAMVMHSTFPLVPTGERPPRVQGAVLELRRVPWGHVTEVVQREAVEATS